MKETTTLHICLERKDTQGVRRIRYKTNLQRLETSLPRSQEIDRLLDKMDKQLDLQEYEKP